METTVIQRSSLNKSRSEQIVIVMRHGERRDGGVDAQPEADPPLTENGVAQVEEAAERLRIMVGENRAKKLLLFVSPFLRTLQTAQELQKCGIGVATPHVIDNTLCEVYGPSRIKCGAPPSLSDEIVKSGCGELPQWGESIELASQRYVENLHRNCRLYPCRHLLFITHGDAISAILSAFYPMRTVYAAEYLSFIVLRKRPLNMYRNGEAWYELLGASGVEWVVDGPESSYAEVYAREEDSVSGRGADGTANAWCPFTNSCGYTSTESNGGLLSTESVATQQRSEMYCKDYSHFSSLLRLAMVCSQLLTFVAWPSKADAAMYMVVVAVLEAMYIGVGCHASRWPRLSVWLRLFEFSPVPGECRKTFVGSDNPSTLRLLAVQFFATVIKAVVIFILCSVLAFFVNLFGLSPFEMLNSYTTCFTVPASILVYLLFWLLNTGRGYYDVKHGDSEEEYF
ncbi:hypothetical protein DQ04_05811020 [Trypanosoma grayi]|uniref:hypothetical protein n=1 Tax=Trypanosoma grayi TaxID=71804 RepID=UPI0004F44346|nr:hypothetical protein DQ04_05811020 [Trypanosoma grayi]KEG09105.1 hypothetical protein DQ04_05811020 [Trypanosoma grayi]